MLAVAFGNSPRSDSMRVFGRSWYHRPPVPLRISHGTTSARKEINCGTLCWIFHHPCVAQTVIRLGWDRLAHTQHPDPDGTGYTMIKNFDLSEVTVNTTMWYYSSDFNYIILAVFVRLDDLPTHIKRQAGSGTRHHCLCSMLNNRNRGGGWIESLMRAPSQVFPSVLTAISD